MSEPDVPLAAEFEPPTREAWLALVEKALKGGDFEKRLVSRTADGLAIQPLYTRSDERTGRCPRRAHGLVSRRLGRAPAAHRDRSEGGQRGHPGRPRGRRHVGAAADPGARAGGPQLRRRGTGAGAQGRLPQCLHHRAGCAREHARRRRQPAGDLARPKASTRTTGAAPSTTTRWACWPRPARSTIRRIAPARSPPSSPPTPAPCRT